MQNTYRPFQFNNDKPDRLKIIDPNRPENNISGGSNKIGLIFQSFGQAHDILQEQLKEHDDGRAVASFLEQLVGGNFESYDTQRDFLRDLHYGPDGQRAPAVIPPPPPLILRQAQVPVRTRSNASADESRTSSVPHVNGAPAYGATASVRIPLILQRAPTDESKVFGQSGTRQFNSASNASAEFDSDALKGVTLRNTLVRFKKLRPPLAERAEGALNMRELASIGGYGNVPIMLTDLDNRQAKIAPGVANDLDRREQDSDGDDFSSPSASNGLTGSQVFKARLDKARRFRPDLSAKISQCTSKKELAELCGYQAIGQLTAAIAAWEGQQNQQPPGLPSIKEKSESTSKGVQPKNKKKKGKGKD
jgi:hypothetical protein